jgi:transposase
LAVNCTFLSKDEILQILKILAEENRSSQKRKRAYAIFLSNQGNKTNQEIAESTGLSVRGIEEIFKRLNQEGFASTVRGKIHPRKELVINQQDETKLVALIQLRPGDGNKKWTLRALKEEFVTTAGRKVSHETIRRVLKRKLLALR